MAESTANKQHECTICAKPATKNCANCHGAYYCSRICQKQDWPLHKVLCDQYRDILAMRPQPSSAKSKNHRFVSSAYKLTILLPEESDPPQLIWLEIKTPDESDDGHSQERTYEDP